MQLKRIQRIGVLESLLFSGAMTSAELAKTLEVSSSTIRRDLNWMQRIGGAPIRYRCGVGWYWHRTDIRKRISIEEAEAKHLPINETPERLREHPELRLPFGFLNSRWKALINRIQPGDELWEFCSEGDSWENLSGRSGIELVRGGRIIGRIVTLMN
jgi:hypothetical protein